MNAQAAPTALEVYQRPQTAVEIRAHVNLIQEVMKAVMKEDTHYGIIPGCKKPSLWKPGAEVLFTTFRIAVDPKVEDLSTRDEARFRVTATAMNSSGIQLGSAVGEASSDEEKYRWREVVCQQEWDATAEDQRRLKWKRGRESAYSVQQIRASIADCRNTVLKMAAKRASVALALQVIAASDIFTQDIEDLPEEMRSEEDVAAPAPLPTEIKRKEPTTVQAAPVEQPPAPRPVPRPASVVQQPRPTSARVISEPQARRFYAIHRGAGKTKEQVDGYLREVIGVQSDRDIPADRYNEACAWAEKQEGRW